MSEKTKKILKGIAEALLGIAIVAVVMSFLPAVIFILFISRHPLFHFIILVCYTVLILALLIGFMRNSMKKKMYRRTVLSGFAAVTVVFAGFSFYQIHKQSIPKLSEKSDLLVDYAPYGTGTKAVSLDDESTLQITEDFPIIDGATALYPIYASFAKAIYPKEILDNITETTVNGNVTSVRRNKNDYLDCSTTTYAYRKIVDGEADIIFAALPSDEQLSYAEENGVELVFTPIGKEAFVFFVNSKNPINDISVTDIQKIYSGELTKWSELGIKGLGDIRAFQRDAGSGSQSTLEKLMAGKELMTPPTENVVSGMGGIISKTADYRNYKNAIGYSFRFYTKEMVANDDIKVLSINGVYPDTDTIEDGTYPLASYFYAVTRSDADENTLKILEWVQGGQAQRIIELVGYTPLEK